MSNNLEYISDLLGHHYEEAHNGVVDKAPSRLTRGEGTEKNFYILKIDLVGSTGLLLKRHKSTYLKVAHTYLSTIDEITQSFGADPDQVEYAGDSVLAYFQDSVSAEDVISAACFSRAAVMELRKLDETLSKLNLRCKIVLHYAPLLVAKIGPRANSITTAIGHPLHRVAKIEKNIDSDIGRVTKEFYKKIYRENKKYLTPVYTEKLVQVPATPALDFVANSLFGSSINQNSLSILDVLTSPPQPQWRTERTVIGYNLLWGRLFRALDLLQRKQLMMR